MAFGAKVVAAGLIAGAVMVSAAPAFAATDDPAVDNDATRRARITVFPRYENPGPNAERRCESWLQKEYRVSGTVVTPQMRCYWR